MNKVILYRKELLRISETFIKAQAQSYRGWDYVLLGERLWPNGLTLDGVNYCTFLPSHPSLPARIMAKARQILGVVTPSMRRLLKAQGATLFHAHFGHDAILALPYARALGIPMVVTLHGHDANVLPAAYHSGAMGIQFKRYPEQLRKLAAQKDVHFIAVSDALRHSAISLYGIPESRIRTLYTGIEIEQFSCSTTPVAERAKRVLFIGRLVEVKGCEYLLRAFHAVQQQVAGAELIIIGDGPLRNDLSTLAARSGINATFMGNVSHNTVTEELAKARVLCLPSITASNGSFEAFGMVLLEAQASGVPVITSALGGKEGVVEGQTGFTFPEKDVTTLTRHLLEVLSNDSLAATLSENAARHARQQFDIKICTARIEAYYDEIVRNASTPQIKSLTAACAPTPQ